MECCTHLRVRYAETDAMGIVHHAVYPVWMELGRSDFLRMLGQSYAAWEAMGVFMPLGELHLRFRQPARYDEEVQVHTRLLEANRRKVTFGYRILRDGVRLAEGTSVHVVTGRNGRAAPMPESLWQLLARGLTADA